MKKTIVVVISTIIISGCGTTSSYHSPSSGILSHATISAPNLEGDFLASTNLTVNINDMDQDCQAIKMGSIVLTPSKKEEEIAVPAGKRIYVWMSYDQFSPFYHRWGNVSFSIIPEMDKNYVFQFMDFQGHMEANVFNKNITGELTKVQADRYASCQKNHPDMPEQNPVNK